MYFMCLCWCEGNSKSKVLYFIPAERVSASCWQAYVQLVQCQTAVAVSTSDNVNRHSSGCKMAIVLEEWSKEEVRSVIRFFYGKKFQPIEIHRELATVYGGNVMAAQRVHKWCREFDSGQVNVKDEQRSGWPSTSADSVQNIDVAVQAGRCVSIAQMELRFNLS